MLALSALPLGIQTTVLDPASDACAAAAADQIIAPFDDAAALGQLGARSDVITFEFENVPASAVEALAAEHKVAPNARALAASQDRFAEKQLFRQLGIGTAEFRAVETAGDLETAFAELGPLIIKTRRLGYDGKGQARVQTAADFPDALAVIGEGDAIAEGLVPFDRELSQVSVRAADGSVAHYPLAQNVHRDGILRTSVAPAPGVTDKLAQQARAYSESLMEHLGYVGVIAIELFDVNGDLVANEFAPRVHNSGHWTIDGAACSQFENHMRAVSGLPLGSTALITNCVMFNLIGEAPPLASLAAMFGLRVHLYGKKARAGRKVGHVTLLNVDSDFEKNLVAVQALIDQANP
ncbi:MAG: 5-(carboxyamino)imidazole ribonucleotide synthase [Thermoleophilaceae bacterium]|nr:5-(carboxyamino)imidazole ribonucleotide synthase [Thermoleophilaceae bacterium]